MACGVLGDECHPAWVEKSLRVAGERGTGSGGLGGSEIRMGTWCCPVGLKTFRRVDGEDASNGWVNLSLMQRTDDGGVRIDQFRSLYVSDLYVSMTIT